MAGGDDVSVIACQYERILRMAGIGNRVRRKSGEKSLRKSRRKFIKRNIRFPVIEKFTAKYCDGGQNAVPKRFEWPM